MNKYPEFKKLYRIAYKKAKGKYSMTKDKQLFHAGLFYEFSRIMNFVFNDDFNEVFHDRLYPDFTSDWGLYETNNRLKTRDKNKKNGETTVRGNL